MNILFLINSLQRNGAERVAINLLSYLSKNNPQDNYYLCPLEDTDNPLTVSKQIELFKIGTGTYSNFSKFLILPLHALRLKKIIKNKEIDTVISFLSRSNYVNILAGIMGSKHRRIISERNIPSLIYNTKSIPDVLNRFLKKILYPLSDLIIAISKGVKEDLINRFGIPEKKIAVIYNPLDIEKIEKESAAQVDHKWLQAKDKYTIITIGRLERPKNQQLLIRAFKKVTDAIPQTRLIIIGEGSLNSPLFELSQDLDISEKIEFAGYQNNPYAFLTRADLFILSSSSEGFGNVIPEAMVCGCPVISTNCPSGPGEIISDGKDGILVPVNDVDALSDAIISLFKNSERRQKLIDNAQVKITQFALPNIAGQYHTTLF